MMTRLFRTQTFIIFLMGLITLPAQAALDVKITQGSTQAIPIAVVPFKAPESMPVALDEVISHDLAASGLFEPMEVGDMLDQPSDPERINFKDWRMADVDDVVIGSVALDANQRYQIKFYVLNPFIEKQIAGYSIGASEKNLRRVGHTIANLVYKEILGRDSYFLSRIAYISSTHDKGKHLYRLMVSDYDGYNPQSIFSSHDPIMSPAWSPDGSKIAYVAFDERRGRSTLRIQDVATGEIRNISGRPGINGSPSWSPDGKKLTMTLSFQGSPSIYSYNLEQRKLHRLTMGYNIDTEAVWSANGRYIYFTSDRGGSPQIYRMDANGKHIKRMTFTGYNSQDAAVSADGKWLAFVEKGPNGYRIAKKNLKTDEVTRLTKGPLDESPDFAPNSQAVIYTTQSPREGLAMVSIDGEVHTQLVQKDKVREASWGVTP